MDTLRVDIDAAKCSTSVYNNGVGVPIEEVHPGEGVYVPEVIFGRLSGKCEPNLKEEELIGGRNGYGVKLANIFSTEFVIETADGPGQKKYKQVKLSLKTWERSQITGYRKGVNWTMVTFKPDLAKFNMTYLEEDTLALMKKRAFDMAGILGVTVKVVFNGRKMLLLRGFPSYVHRHIKPLSSKSFPWFCEKVNDQLEVGVSLSGGQFKQRLHHMAKEYGSIVHKSSKDY
ncbi:hypothetical protein EJB05_38114, partial [Eragrostis curvula]